MESCCFLFGYVTFDRLLIWSTSSLGICISQLVVWIVNKRGNLCICRAFIPVDHHLTTSSSPPALCIVFCVPTFFYNHQKQRRKLCTLHNFRRCIFAFCRPSQFSDQTTTSNWTIADCFLYSQAPQSKKQTNCRLLSRECEANGTNPSARQVNIRKFFLEGL